MDPSTSQLETPADSALAQNAPANERPVIQQYARYTSTAGLSQSMSPPSNPRKQPSPLSSPERSGRDINAMDPSPSQSHLAIPTTSTNSTPSTSSPFFTSSHQRTGDVSVSAEARSLPSRDITDATMDDAYVDFILYCNPSVSATADTSELRRIFRAPPRSDGKSFNMFALWQLIQKLDRKEIKTWIQLAMQLGVEPPSLEKKQSTQKVQQYTVRLKRWMHAMHVDAFFEYCLGHQHPYYTELHSSYDDSFESRDGVSRDEDLALRALHPEWKPKKGRKRAAVKDSPHPKRTKHLDADTPIGARESKSPSFNGGTLSHAESTTTWSAFPDDAEPPDLWEAALGPSGDASSPYVMRPEFDLSQRHASPALQYPHSAITPRYRDSVTPTPNEPQSAITVSVAEKMQKRRRAHVVSSAWAAPSSPAGGNPGRRGRPPSHRTFQHGLFTSFPAQKKDPYTSEASNESLTHNMAQNVEQNVPASEDTGRVQSSPLEKPHSRPAKLQLMVPQNIGAPVRLATPPVVLVNGEHDAGSSSISQATTLNHDSIRSKDHEDGQVPDDVTLDDVVQAFTTQVYHGTLVNRSAPLSTNEAKKIAENAVNLLRLQCSPKLTANAFVVYCVACLGLGHQLGFGGSPPSRLTIDVSSIPSQPSMESALEGFTATSGPLADSKIQYTIKYDLEPSPGLAINATLQKASPLANQQLQVRSNDQNRNINDNNASMECNLSDDEDLDGPTDWKQRYINLRKQIRRKDAAINKYKKRILEAVMTDI